MRINGSVYDVVPERPASEARFRYYAGGLASGAKPYRAIYPSTFADASGATLFPATQFCRGNGKFEAPMCSEEQDGKFIFRNIGGILEVRLSGGGVVKSISLQANEPLRGPFSLDSETGEVELTGGDADAYKTVTLDCGPEGVQLQRYGRTNFYLYLPPKTYAAGMQVTVAGIDTVYTTTEDITIERNGIHTLNFAGELPLELKYLIGEEEENKIWTLNYDANGAGAWGNGGSSGNGNGFTKDDVDGIWWSVKSPEALAGQTDHAKGLEEKGLACASDGAYMVFSDDGTITSYDAQDNVIFSSSFEVCEFDANRPTGWELGKLYTEGPAILWPFSINAAGAIPDFYEIMYLDESHMTLTDMYFKGTTVGSWSEITFWRFKAE